jgi:hypothetical protein
MHHVVAKNIQKQVKQNKKKEISRNMLPASAGSLFDLLFDPKDGGDMFP